MNPLTVNAAGVASEVCALPGDAVPLEHDSDTVTDSGLWSEKLLATTNPPLFTTFTIVHVPTESGAAHVPLDE